jgi:hypothetical protein
MDHSALVGVSTIHIDGPHLLYLRYVSL